MTLGIGILNGITGTGKASDQLPAQGDIVAKFQNSVTEDDEQWIDTNASGNYEVEEAESIDIAPGKTIEFSAIGVGFSLTVNSGTATCSFSGTTLSCTVGGSLFDFVLNDGSTTWTYSGGEGSDQPTLYANEVGGPTGTLTGFTLPTDRVQSIEFGHEWSNYSVIGDGSKIPADPISPGLDVLGNPLTNPGTPQKNLKVTGYTGAWDGTTYGALSTPVTLIGDFKIQFTLKPATLNSGLISGNTLTEGAIYLTGGGAIRVFIENIPYEFPDLILLTGTLYTLEIFRYGSTLTALLNDVEYIVEGSGADLTLRYLSRYAGSVYDGILRYFQTYDSTHILINHWICESSPTSLQDTVYDIVGGNHATLTDATLPFFTTETEGSKLFADGFDDVGGSTGLVPYGANTGALTNQPTEFIGDYCLFDAPLSTTFYDAAVVAGIDTDLYLAGAAIGLTADAWILLASNPLFFGALQNILVMYNDTQSGDTLDQINDYLGI